jgi:hypothetical protein
LPLLSGQGAESAAGGRVDLRGPVDRQEETADAVRLAVQEAAGRAVVTFSYPEQPLDLAAFRDVAVPVTNQTAAEFDVLVMATSSGRDSWKESTTGRFLVRPAEQTALRTLLPRKALPSDHPHVKKLGNLYGFPWGHHRHWRFVRPEAITRVTVQLTWRNATPGQTITVGRPRGAGSYTTDPAVLDSLPRPLVDTFGQSRLGSWPGRVESAGELAADGQEAEKLLQENRPSPADRDRFGGWVGGPTGKATGFFRVEKLADRWWIIDPEGNVFWSLGINSTGFGTKTRVKGREDLFPEAQRQADEVNAYEENLRLKFGAEAWPAKHVDLTVARMWRWGFNTVGAWSKREVLETQRIPYTLIVHTDMQGLGSVEKIPDPWSRAFAESLERRMADLAATHSASPWLLGVFVDNELDWQNGNGLVRQILASPAGTPARGALLDFLRGRYPTITALNAAWGTTAADFAALRPPPETGATAACEADLDAFLAEFAREYFARCRAAMDEHFPRHLYLGSRFHVFNPIVTAAASRYCDVLSINIYRHSVEDLAVTMDQDRPWLISEFHFGVRDLGNLGVGLTWAADARNQADLVTAYLSEALRLPNVVGAHWFAWADQTVTGRGDGENFGIGLVTVVDRPNPTLVEAMQTVAAGMYQFRLDAPEDRIGTPTGPRPRQEAPARP